MGLIRPIYEVSQTGAPANLGPCAAGTSCTTLGLGLGVSSSSRFSVLTVTMLLLAATASVTTAEEQPSAACSPAFITEVVDFCDKAFGDVKKTGDLAQDAILNAGAIFKCCQKAKDGVTTECGCVIHSALAAERVGGNFVETGCLNRYNCPSQ